MSVWDDIADSREEAENLKVRAELMRAIRGRITEEGWSQSAAAEHLRLTQPRVSDLFRGKISKFSLDALVDAAAKLGIHVHVVVEDRHCTPAGPDTTTQTQPQSPVP